MSTGGGDLNSLTLLPNKLKTEIALHVNLETLRKVKSRCMMFSYSGYEIHLVKNGFKNSAFSLFFFRRVIGQSFLPFEY